MKCSLIPRLSPQSLGTRVDAMDIHSSVTEGVPRPSRVCHLQCKIFDDLAKIVFDCLTD